MFDSTYLFPWDARCPRCESHIAKSAVNCPNCQRPTLGFFRCNNSWLENQPGVECGLECERCHFILQSFPCPTKCGGITPIPCMRALIELTREDLDDARDGFSNIEGIRKDDLYAAVTIRASNRGHVARRVVGCIAWAIRISAGFAFLLLSLAVMVWLPSPNFYAKALIVIIIICSYIIFHNVVVNVFIEELEVEVCKPIETSSDDVKLIHVGEKRWVTYHESKEIR